MGVRLTCVAFVFILLAFCAAFLQSGQVSYQASRTCVAQASAQTADQSQVSVSGYLAGAPVNGTRVARASGELKQHHNYSALAQQVALQLSSSATVMAHAWCDTCQENCSNRLQCCGKCGTQLQVYTQQDSQPPWRPYQSNSSPRRRWQADWTIDVRTQSPRRRASPRRRGKEGGALGKSGHKGQPHTPGQGKGKGDAADKSRQVPKVQDLPQPPSVTTPAKASATVKTETMEERSQGMSGLLTQLASSRDSLPPELQQLVDKELEQDSRATTKGLRRLVTLQGQARKELSSLGKAREQFLAEWAQHIADLCALLENESKDERLKQLDAAEETWQQQLNQATAYR